MRAQDTTLFALLAALCLAPGAAPGADEVAMDTESAVVPGQIAPRLQTLGSHEHPITTSSPRGYGSSVVR